MPAFDGPEENFECIDETDEQGEARAGAMSRTLVESMLARSLAWQYLKQFGVKRPRVVIIGAKCATAKVDIQKYRRSTRRDQKVPKSYCSVSYRKKPSLA